MNTIAVDAMGGDHAPRAQIAGAVAAVREAPVQVLLVGDRERIAEELRRLEAHDEDRLEVAAAGQVVTMTDPPTHAFRAKRDSSLRVGCECVQEQRAHALVTAGNSGAAVVHGAFVFGRSPGVERPGIVSVLPTPSGTVTLCDVGASVDIKPSVLAQFGVLAANYDRVIHGHDRPRLGLLSNGIEATKGTELTRAAHEFLTRASESADANIEYVGYVEGADLFRGRVDAVATDGFTGNVLLKVSEGVSEAVYSMIHKQLQHSLLGRLGGALARPAFLELKRTIDYAETGGALLAGLERVLVICHGNSDATAIKNAIHSADRFVDAQLTDELAAAVGLYGAAWGMDELPVPAHAGAEHR